MIPASIRWIVSIWGQRQRQVVATALKLFSIDQPIRQRLSGEFPVALTAGRALGQHQVVDLQAPSGGSTGVLTPDRHQTPLPPCRRLRGFGPNRVRVVAKGRIEIGAIAKASLDLVRPLGMVSWKDIRLTRDQHRRRRIWELAENRLTADDDQLIVVGDFGSRTDHVFELLPLQSGPPI